MPTQPTQPPSPGIRTQHHDCSTQGDPGDPAGDGRAIVLARGDSGQGELVLRRRGEVLELVVDGVFAMDSAHTATEAALATLALDRLSRTGRPSGTAGTAGTAGPGGWRILVGGLGLGYTLAAVLSDLRVTAVDVVELQGLLVDWTRAGLVVPSAGLLDDPRVRVVVGDVRTVIESRSGCALSDSPHAVLTQPHDTEPPAPEPYDTEPYDTVLLDVDNGPHFLVHQHNAEIYRAPFLRAALQALSPGGMLAIWSADPDPALQRLLHCAGGEAVEEVLHDVERDSHQFTYAVYLTRRPASLTHRPPQAPALRT